MNEFRKKYVKEYLAEIKQLLTSREADFIEKIDKLADIFNKARKNKNTIFLMGNGGSASTASHVAIDLSKCTIANGQPRFRVIALTDSIPSMLAWANDASFEDIFIEQGKREELLDYYGLSPLKLKEKFIETIRQLKD